HVGITDGSDNTTVRPGKAVYMLHAAAVNAHHGNAEPIVGAAVGRRLGLVGRACRKRCPVQRGKRRCHGSRILEKLPAIKETHSRALVWRSETKLRAKVGF